MLKTILICDKCKKVLDSDVRFNINIQEIDGTTVKEDAFELKKINLCRECALEVVNLIRKSKEDSELPQWFGETILREIREDNNTKISNEVKTSESWQTSGVDGDLPFPDLTEAQAKELAKKNNAIVRHRNYIPHEKIYDLYSQGKTYREIAEEIGLEPLQVKNSIAKHRAKLRTMNPDIKLPNFRGRSSREDMTKDIQHVIDYGN